MKIYSTFATFLLVLTTVLRTDGAESTALRSSNESDNRNTATIGAEPAVPIAAPDGNKCEVECQKGYYACCIDNLIFEDTCECRRNGLKDNDCTHGGAGASYCAIGYD